MEVIRQMNDKGFFSESRWKERQSRREAEFGVGRHRRSSLSDPYAHTRLWLNKHRPKGNNYLILCLDMPSYRVDQIIHKVCEHPLLLMSGYIYPVTEINLDALESVGVEALTVYSKQGLDTWLYRADRAEEIRRYNDYLSFMPHDLFPVIAKCPVEALPEPLYFRYDESNRGASLTLLVEDHELVARYLTDCAVVEEFFKDAFISPQLKAATDKNNRIKMRPSMHELADIL